MKKKNTIKTSRTSGQYIFEYDTIEFLSKYIDIRSLLYVDDKNHLTQREKEYLIACIMLKSKGFDLVSAKSKKYLQNEWMFKNRGVDIYRGKLKEKGWIIQTTDSVILPPDLTFTNGIPKVCNYKFSFKRRSNENDN